MRRNRYALEEWGNGKYVPLAGIAQNVALAAEDCLEACLLARKDTRSARAKRRRPADAWTSLYARGEALMRGVTESLFGGSAEADNLREILESAEMVKEPLPSRKEIASVLRELGVTDFSSLVQRGKELTASWEKGAADALRAQFEVPPPSPVDFKERLAEPEVLFFFRVYFPCWLEYGVKLPDLVRDAAGGDMDALRDLLRLDKCALELPKIRRRYRAAEGTLAFRSLEHALTRRPLRNLTLRKVKMSLAAWVYTIFAETDAGFRKMDIYCAKHGIPMHHARVKLTAPDVQRLFDAVARDVHGKRRDGDLPRSPRTFYMALRREARFWKGSI